MKNPSAVGYKDKCWHVGNINDTEFGVLQELYVDTCDKEAEHVIWQTVARMIVQQQKIGFVRTLDGLERNVLPFWRRCNRHFRPSLCSHKKDCTSRRDWQA